ncbi:MAG: GNAT family N-acetyltransferase [Cytophagales bacterium]|nr:MAG: GNAT family N-acetyltransferase [Cytophagales bacterium]
MKLIELTSNDHDRYKAFFMNGLHTHRDCFRISPDDEQTEPFPTKGTADSFTLGLLTDAGELAGVVSFSREGQTRQKLRHKGLLFRMYVAASFAGQGLGQQLLEETIRRVQTQTDIEQIVLTVVSTNHSAKRLYEKMGFRSFSLEPNAIKDGDTYHDEEQMVLFLNL